MTDLAEYREHQHSMVLDDWSMDLYRASRAIRLRLHDPYAFRRLVMPSWYGAVLVAGPRALDEVWEVWHSAFANECQRELDPPTSGELLLAGYANLFACCSHLDCVEMFRHRLAKIPTQPAHGGGPLHVAKALAAVALGLPEVYRPLAGLDLDHASWGPVAEGALHAPRAQGLVAHLARAVERGASLAEVWPAFERFMVALPIEQGCNTFDGAGLFWAARIVHHQIGGQPVGTTAAWLQRHLHAWADGVQLPPLGADA
jgi:hypothetical protein